MSKKKKLIIIISSIIVVVVVIGGILAYQEEQRYQAAMVEFAAQMEKRRAEMIESTTNSRNMLLEIGEYELAERRQKELEELTNMTHSEIYAKDMELKAWAEERRSSGKSGLDLSGLEKIEKMLEEEKRKRAQN